MPNRRKVLRSAAWWHDYLLGWVKEPRSLTYLTSAMYLTLAALTGVSALLSPPSTFSHRLGEDVTMLWGGLIAVGGILAVAGTLPGWWWLERTGILALGSGLIVYAAVVITMHVETPGNRLPQTGLLIAGVLCLVIRWLRVRGAFTDPAGG